MEVYLGIDVGSVTAKFVLLDGSDELLLSLYLRIHGQPVAALQQGLREVAKGLPSGCRVRGVGITGSARRLIGLIIGADVIKNEITAHAVAALKFLPDVRTVIEVGGQDSKIILIRDGAVADFAMNTVCAAGTGSFLDQQAWRLNMTIDDFGRKALCSKTPARIAGRCTVFAESDMIHKQQMGYSVEDIIYGLCQAMVRNYLNSVALGKEILTPVVFQGGVAFNQGVLRALEEALITRVIVPPRHEVMGAIGAALLVHEEMMGDGNGTRFKGFDITEADLRISSFECEACPCKCETVQGSLDGAMLAKWGG